MTPPTALSLRRALVVAGYLACGALLSACGAASTGGSFSSDQYPFAFEYPTNWTLTRAQPVGNSGATVTVALREPLDQVQLTSFKLKKEIPTGESGNQGEVDAIVRQSAKRSGGTIGKVKPVEYGGGEGYRYIIEYSNGGMEKLRSRLIFLFHGEDLVQINCQSSVENRKKLAEGCDKVLKTLELK